MSVVFERVADEVEKQAQREKDDRSDDLLRALDHRARSILGLFAQQKFIRSSDVAHILGLSTIQILKRTHILI